MLKNMISSSLRVKRFGYTTVICALLALGGTVAQAQTAPTPQLQPDHYYLNGKASTKQEVDALNPKTIVRTDVLSGEQAVKYTHDPKTTGAVLVQTK
jgi:hypothetical protein